MISTTSTSSATTSSLSSSSSAHVKSNHHETESTSSASAPPDQNLLDNQLYQLSEGWLELESDPGLFTLLINDFGCKGIEVEEIYDLATPFTQQIYGFIFLFNVVEERRSRSKSPSSLLTGEYIENEDFLKTTFFAYQKVPNSCATHAILSVLMNCDQIDIGPTLMHLKAYTKDMTPENKGYAIGNMAELAHAHNAHAAPISSQLEQQMKQNTNAVRVSQRNSSSCEAFHFVSFVPINGHLIELDGLKEYPIDHGSYTENGVESWTEMFRQLIRKRIETPYGVSHDIRYNLMAVIPNKCDRNRIMLETLEKNQILVLKMVDFLEFSSDYCHLNQHNYTQCNYLETRFTAFPHPYPTLPFDKRLNLDLEKDSVVIDIDEPMMDCGPLSPCSVNTETASEANSTFNYCEDVVESGQTNIGKEKLILCKLVDSRQDTTVSDYLPPLDSFVSGSSNKTVNCTNSNINNNNCIDQHSLKLINGECLANDNDNQNVDPYHQNNSQQLLSSVKRQFKQFQNYKQQPIHPRYEFEIKRRIMNDIRKLLPNLSNEIRKCKATVRDEEAKLKRFSEDDMRRIHDYDPFINTFLAMFSELGFMEQFVSGELCNSQQTHYPLAAAASSIATGGHHHQSGSNSSNSQDHLQSASLNIPNSRLLISNYDDGSNLFLPPKFPLNLNAQNRDSVLEIYRKLFRTGHDSQQQQCLEQATKQENEDSEEMKPFKLES